MSYLQDNSERELRREGKTDELNGKPFQNTPTDTNWWGDKPKALDPTSAVSIQDQALQQLNTAAESDMQTMFARPALRAEGMHSVLGEIAQAGSQYTEAVPSTLAMHVLTRFAATIGRSSYVQIGDQTRHLRINALIVGPTSVGRKGTSTDLSRRVFAAVEEKNLLWPPLKELTALSTGEGLIHQVRDPHTTPARGRVPAQVDPGVADKRLFCDVSEFAGVYAVSKRESATISTVLRDAFDGRTLTTPSKTSFNRATDTHILCFGSITEAEILLTLSDNDKTNGLANRFPMFYSSRSKLVPQPPPTDQRAVAYFAQRIEAAVTFAWQTSVIGMTAEAATLWNDAYHFRAKETFPAAVVPLLARRDVYAWTYAALLALLDLKKNIEPAHLYAAFAWVDYWRDTALFVFSSGKEAAYAEAKQRLADRIVGALFELGGRDVPYAALMDKLTNKGKSKAMQPAALKDAFELLLRESPVRVSKRTEKTSGRPAAIFNLTTPPTGDPN